MRARTISISRSLSRDNNANPPASGTNIPDIPGKVSTRPGLLRRLANRVYSTAPPGKFPTTTVPGITAPSTSGTKREGSAQPLRTDMIKRVETFPQRVDQTDRGKGKDKGWGVDNGHHLAKTEAGYENGGEVQHATASLSGSRAQCDGAESPNPIHRDSTPTPKQLAHNVAPSVNLVPAPTGLHLKPFMEIPAEISDDGNGILRRIARDGEPGIDEGTEVVLTLRSRDSIALVWVQTGSLSFRGWEACL